jgi:hypothetical protein
MFNSIYKSIFLSVSLLMVASPGVVIGQDRPVRATAPVDDGPPVDEAGPSIPPPPGTDSKSQIHIQKKYRSSVRIFALIF